MKKVLIFLLITLLLLPPVIPSFASDSPAASPDIINIPSTSFFVTVIRTVSNFFGSIFKLPPKVSQVKISEDGTNIELLPDGVNAGYNIYYFPTRVSGKQLKEDHHIPPDGGRCYMVIETSDGFVTPPFLLSDVCDKKKVLIEYDENGGTGGPVASCGLESVRVSYTVSVRSGYIFTGWSKDKNACTGNIFNYDIIYSDTVLYAVWNKEYKGFVYWTDEDNNRIIITGMKDKRTEGRMDIPGHIDSIPVTGINEFAFSGCKAITEVNIPDTVEHIGQEAFCGCSGLKVINIGKGLRQMGGSEMKSISSENAFEYCLNIEKINVTGCMKEGMNV